jgi:putative oxidoreductase
MDMPLSNLERFAPHTLALLRAISGLLFMIHGLVGAIIEVAAGLFIALGLFTRPAAFLAAGQMAVAYWMFHAPQGFHPILNGGELAILYTFIFLHLAAAGSGAFSLDSARGRSISAVPAAA